MLVDKGEAFRSISGRLVREENILEGSKVDERIDYIYKYDIPEEMKAEGGKYYNIVPVVAVEDCYANYISLVLELVGESINNPMSCSVRMLNKIDEALYRKDMNFVVTNVVGVCNAEMLAEKYIERKGYISKTQRVLGDTLKVDIVGKAFDDGIVEDIVKIVKEYANKKIRTACMIHAPHICKTYRESDEFDLRYHVAKYADELSEYFSCNEHSDITYKNALEIAERVPRNKDGVDMTDMCIEAIVDSYNEEHDGIFSSYLRDSLDLLMKYNRDELEKYQKENPNSLSNDKIYYAKPDIQGVEISESVSSSKTMYTVNGKQIMFSNNELQIFMETILSKMPSAIIEQGPESATEFINKMY